MFYTVFNSTFGWTGIVYSNKGIRLITLPQNSRQKVLDLIAEKCRFLPPYQEPEHPLCDKLKSYYDGRRVEFDTQLDFSGITAFQREVWEMTAHISYGTVTTYGWLARQIGRPQAARAVGQALGKNPFPIVVPCHRVIGSQGDLHGFGGGLELKAKLLALEGYIINK